MHHHNNDNNNYNPQATAHCEKLFRLIDIDGDGNLTEAEFLRVELDYIITNHIFYIISKLICHTSCPQGCLNDGILLLNLKKIIDNCQPPTAFQSSYY